MAEYTDFPDNPEAGDIVDKNGRTWYYDGTKYVLFVDPTNTGDLKFDAIDPVEVSTKEEPTGINDETRSVITTYLDLNTLDKMQGTNG